MSIKQIIKEAMEKNPLGLKEALEEELRSRVGLALEAKMKKEEDDYEDDEDDMDDLEDEDDMDEEAQAGKKAEAIAKKEGNSGVSNGPIVKV